MSSSIRPNRRRKTATASITAAAAAVVAPVLVAPAATAASATPGDFSSLTTRANPQQFVVDDCTVEVGVVVDATPYPDYHHVGGVRVNCSSRHSVVHATVALYYWNGSRFVQYGAGAHGVRFSTTGSGYGVGGILRTPAHCVGSLRAQEWIVGATVRTEHTGRTVFSTSQKDTAAGC